MEGFKNENKTSVESVKLGKTSNLSKNLSLKFSTPLKIGLRRIINVMNHLIFVRKAYIPNFRPQVPFLHVKKFVGGGLWV